MQWLKDGFPVKPSSRLRVVTRGPASSSLTMSHVSKEDSGVYQCAVTVVVKGITRNAVATAELRLGGQCHLLGNVCPSQPVL